MPMYDFQCVSCGHRAEKLIRTPEANPAISCSKCGGIAIKIVSVPAPPRFSGKDWTPKFYPKT
jgi:putative FmdB family regulatory protein